MFVPSPTKEVQTFRRLAVVDRAAILCRLGLAFFEAFALLAAATASGSVNNAVKDLDDAFVSSDDLLGQRDRFAFDFLQSFTTASADLENLTLCFCGVAITRDTFAFTAICHVASRMPVPLCLCCRNT